MKTDDSSPKVNPKHLHPPLVADCRGRSYHTDVCLSVSVFVKFGFNSWFKAIQTGRDDWLLSLTHDWSSPCIGGTSSPDCYCADSGSNCPRCQRSWLYSWIVRGRCNNPSMYTACGYSDHPKDRQTNTGKTNTAQRILRVTPVSGGFLQAGLLQSNVTVTISALPKLTIHWHGCSRQRLHRAAPRPGQCTQCCDGIGQNRECSGRQSNRTGKLHDYEVSATFF